MGVFSALILETKKIFRQGNPDTTTPL